MASFFSPAPQPVDSGVHSSLMLEPAIRAPASAKNKDAGGAARPVDFGFVVGLAVTAAAVIAGLASAGISLGDFLRPASALIVLGGMAGVILISSPAPVLARTLSRVAALFRPSSSANPGALMEEILDYARMARRGGILSMEPAIARASHPFLRQVLALALDARDRVEFRAALDVMLRARERQGDADAKVLENAGGFAPTLGVLGTVVGLIDALAHFSDLAGVGAAVGMAFLSTFYGLALANLILLPAAHRIRAAAEEDARLSELIADGCLAIYDGVHPTLLRDRLQGFLHQAESAGTAPRGAEVSHVRDSVVRDSGRFGAGGALLPVARSSAEPGGDPGAARSRRAAAS